MSTSKVLLKIKTNEIIMMKKRGFNIKDAKIFLTNEELSDDTSFGEFEEDENPFLGHFPDMKKFQDLKDKGWFQSRKDYSMEYTKYERVGVIKNNKRVIKRVVTDRTVVLYLESKPGKQTGVAALNPMLDAISANDGEKNFYTSIILITTGKLSSTAKKRIEQYKFNIFIFQDHDFFYDIFSNVASPINVRYWSPKEQKEFEEKENIKVKRLPLIKKYDPYIKKLGLLPGYVIMTKLPIPGKNFGDEMVDYRLVK